MLNAAAPADFAGEPRCWINIGWSHGLDLSGALDRTACDAPAGQDEQAGGLASILIAREVEHSNKLLVAGILVDVWCLGVKNATRPEHLTPARLAEYRAAYFHAHRDLRQIPAALVRDLVFGAVAYARRLGFEPHEGFEQAAAVLGEPTGPSPIGFGRDGNPFYIDGPYDDAAAVLATLRRSVGENNFHFLAQMPDQPRRRLPSLSRRRG